MALGASAAFIDTALDAALAVYAYAQLHTGAPGAAGTSNVATEDTRIELTFADAASGSAATSADAVWTDVAATETYTDVTLWSAATGGTFGASGSITADEITAGQDFTIDSGDLTVSMTAAS